ncbi:MAG: PKD domain-containing protein [Bacteroidales bacterium]|nr:PKD domain-containing protein [Bacteroidales bacterium]
MKINSLKIFIISIFLLIGATSFGQQYLISQGGTITTCEGTLYDSGGPNGNYSSSENYTITICSEDGNFLVLNFTQFEFESGTYDKLSIYDGPNTTSPALVTNAGGTTLLNQTFTSTGSCLTLHMQTDGYITRPGFAAVISCLPPCQDFEIDIISTSLPFSQPLDSMWINVCLGESITFTAAGTYPNNNVNYTQSDATTDWYWTLSSSGPPIEANGVGMTTFTHTFNESGGYFLGLVGKDANGCLVSYLEQIRVRVSIPPNLSVDPAVGGCISDAIELSGHVTTNSWEIVIADEQIVQECITDDQGVVQSFCWNINAFQPGQTITSLNDLEHVCLNIEHSWIADVWIYIECPNGQQAEINYYSTSNPCSGEFFGSPNHSDNCVPGTGWDYCWTMNATQSHTAWCQGNSGSVPPGDYLPTGNFADLIGCPINGEWCVVIIDDWDVDDGTLFSVDIGFNQAVTPSYLWSYSHTYAPTGMSWSGNGLGANSGGTATAIPIASGTQAYNFCVTDDFGCSYCIPTTAEVLSIDDPSCCILPSTNAGLDAAVCSNTYTFNASIAAGNTGTWNMISGPGTATWANQNSPHATVTVSEWGVYEFEWTEQYLSPTCVDKDRVTVEFWPIPTTTFTYQPIMCNADHSTITYVGNMTGSATFNWDFDGAAVVNGSGVGPYTIYWTEPGMHSVGLNITENGCSSADTLVNILNPVVLEHSIEVDNDPCFASCGGRAEVFPTGGTEPYTYSWASQNPVLPNLCEGNYTITVTDANNCTTGQNFTVTEPPLLLINDISFNHLICYQSNDGNISITASGGTGDLTYLWSDIGFGTANRTDIAAGEYCVTITDENGCSVTDCVTITQPNELLVTVSPNVAICEESQTVLQAQAMGGTVPYTYMWRYHQDSSFNPGPSTYTVSPDTTRMFEVYVLDAHGCTSNIATIKVTVSPKMIIDTMLIKHNRCYQSCDGRAEIVMHGGLAPLQYSWGSDNHIYSGLCAGIYTVTVTDLIGCSVANNFVIEQPTQLVYSSTVKPATCFGYDDGEANIYVQGGVSPYTYTWPNGHNTETFVGNAGSYTVTVLDDHNCRIVSDFEITQPSKIIVLPMSNKTICKTQSVSLNNQATGGTPYYDFRWEGSDGSVWNSNLYTVSPSTTTTYSLVVTDSHGCKSDRVSTTVYVNPDLVINSVVTSNDTVCPGDPAIIHVDVEGGNGGPYLMTLQDGRVVPSPFTVNPDTTTMYYITLADMCGTPKVVDSILINARPKPKNLFTVESVAGCPPFAAHFTEETPNFGQTYLWNFGDKKYSTEKNPVHIYKEPGVYTVSLEVKDLFGCKFKREIENFITVYQGPIANFETSSQIVSFIDGEIEFINHSSYASNYYWYFGDGDSSLFVNPRHTYKNIGEYQVILVAETDRYCTDTTTRTISVRNEFAFYMPTSFTPNGDGLNDCARPCGNGIDKEDFSLYIYDKWGTPVFETHKFDPDLSCEACSEGAWDGTFRGNKNKGDEIMETGVYYWYAEFKDLYGTVHKKQGQITLVR